MRRFRLFLSLAVLAILLLTGCTQETMLVLREQASGWMIAQWPFSEGEIFSLEFVHSVNQSPVIDELTRSGDRLLPVRTIYSGLGAGVQTELGPSETLTYDRDGRMVISGFQTKIESLNLIVGTVSDHTLTLKGRTLSLRELCGRNAAVSFTIEP
ncbi:DUF1850 domain-containing protein [Proteiniclasticum sp. QWL-01]|uniref:DUF1850 domain-containing protein n=1 Tax=Proteiniclasticum sp. QWL-01 TaxID=3036945 RepID=UPI00240FB9B9|nr:DUF1850 domain-containing protein [Proteiniclasticum sp. QWL-01]WFF72241.1 DUF1850 domain-containing protein [Proteiniclasticum sp. QWL-01]